MKIFRKDSLARRVPVPPGKRLLMRTVLGFLAANVALAAPHNNAPSPSEVGGVLFAGASGIGHWKSLQEDFKEYKIISKNCSGGMIPLLTSNIHNFFPYKPSIIFVQLGGNDLAKDRTPEQVCADFKDFVKTTRIALPDVCIIFMGLVPTVKRWEQAEAHKKFNQLVKDYTATMKKMDYMEEWDPFLGPDGKPRPDLFIKDGQHNNEEGYKIRAQLTRPYLEKWGAPAKDK